MIDYDIKAPEWVKYRLRYLNADGTKKFKMPDATYNLLMSDPRKFKSYCNGVGSKVGFWGKLTYHFIPNWCWFISIIIEADLHDVGYSIPAEFETRKKARQYKAMIDLNFHDNICLDGERRGGALGEAMKAGAWVRYLAVDNLGLGSFLSGKIILDEIKTI